MPLRVVFMGTPEFAVPSLHAILAHGHTVPLVVTAPARPRGRGRKVSPSAVELAALENGLPVTTPDSLKDQDFLERIRSIRPDVIVVVAFRILPEVLFSIPRYGSVNLHGSLLPRYRGAAPINRAIMAGESVTGVTTFFLRPKVDTGSVILQREIAIGVDMTAGQLHDVMMGIGSEVVVETLDMIERGVCHPTPQNDSEATAAPKIFRSDCELDWHRDSTQLHNRVRGLAPYPGAFTTVSGRVLKILRTRLADTTASVEPGCLVESGGHLFAGTGDRPIEILELQLEGGRSMSADEFLRGHRRFIGLHLGES